MHKIAAGYTSFAKIISRICSFIAAIAAVFLVLLTVGDVLMRFLFSKPILGSFELTEYLLVVIVFLAIPWATMRGNNVRVELITVRLRKKTQNVLYGISCFLSLLLTALIAWYTIPQAKYAYELMEKSDMLDIPTYPFYFLIAVGFFILTIILIAILIQHISRAIGK